MSAPLTLTAEQMRKLADALDAMSEITRTFDVSLTPYGDHSIGLDGNTLTFSWNAEAQAYQIDDRNGD